MSIKEELIRNLIKTLNRENKNRIYHDKSPINICYIISVIDQQIENCKEFIDDITKYEYYINGYDEDNSGGYTNGKIGILIEKPEDEKESEFMVDAYYDYHYEIEFTNDERYWGYCKCTPEDEGYNENYKCCGSGCDWIAPAFRITKVISLGGGNWKGQERDYWNYKEEFNKVEENKNKEVEEFKKKQQKESIERQIKELQDKLKSLNKED